MHSPINIITSARSALRGPCLPLECEYATTATASDTLSCVPDVWDPTCMYRVDKSTHRAKPFFTEFVRGPTTNTEKKTDALKQKYHVYRTIWNCNKFTDCQSKSRNNKEATVKWKFWPPPVVPVPKGLKIPVQYVQELKTPDQYEQGDQKCPSSRKLYVAGEEEVVNIIKALPQEEITNETCCGILNSFESHTFLVSPPRVVFLGTEIGQTYTTTIKVLNNGASPRRMGVINPKNASIDIDWGAALGENTLLAPGLSNHIIVKFRPKSVANVQDTITIFVDDGGAIVIPVIAENVPPAIIEMDEWDVGCCVVGNSQVADFDVVCRGGEGRFWILSEEEFIKETLDIPYDPDSREGTVISALNKEMDELEATRSKGRRAFTAEEEEKLQSLKKEWKRILIRKTNELQVKPFVLLPSCFRLRKNQFVSVRIQYTPMNPDYHIRKLVLLCDNGEVRWIAVKGVGIDGKKSPLVDIQGNWMAPPIDLPTDLSTRLIMDCGDLVAGERNDQCFKLKNNSCMALYFFWTVRHVRLIDGQDTLLRGLGSHVMERQREGLTPVEWMDYGDYMRKRKCPASSVPLKVSPAQNIIRGHQVIECSVSVHAPPKEGFYVSVISLFVQPVNDEQGKILRPLLKEFLSEFQNNDPITYESLIETLPEKRQTVVKPKTMPREPEPKPVMRVVPETILNEKLEPQQDPDPEPEPEQTTETPKHPKKNRIKKESETVGIIPENKRSSLKSKDLSSGEPENKRSSKKSKDLSTGEPENKRSSLKSKDLSTGEPENKRSSVKSKDLSSGEPENKRSSVKSKDLSSGEPEESKRSTLNNKDLSSGERRNSQNISIGIEGDVASGSGTDSASKLGNFYDQNNTSTLSHSSSYSRNNSMVSEAETKSRSSLQSHSTPSDQPLPEEQKEETAQTGEKTSLPRLGSHSDYNIRKMSTAELPFFYIAPAKNATTGDENPLPPFDYKIVQLGKSNSDVNLNSIDTGSDDEIKDESGTDIINLHDKRTLIGKIPFGLGPPKAPSEYGFRFEGDGGGDVSTSLIPPVPPKMSITDSSVSGLVSLELQEPKVNMTVKALEEEGYKLARRFEREKLWLDPTSPLKPFEEIEIWMQTIPLQCWFQPPHISGCGSFSNTVVRNIEFTNRTAYPIQLSMAHFVSHVGSITCRPYEVSVDASQSTILRFTLDFRSHGNHEGIVTGTMKLPFATIPCWIPFQLKAQGPQLFLVTPFINFGLVVVGSENVKTLVLRNDGRLRTKWRARIPPENLCDENLRKLSLDNATIVSEKIIRAWPEWGTIEANETLAIQIYLSPHPAFTGSLSATCEITNEENPEDVCYVTILAHVQGPQVILREARLLLHDAWLGRRTQVGAGAILQNLTSFQTSFTWLHPIGNQQDLVSICVSPKEGILPPKGIIHCTFELYSEVSVVLTNLYVPCCIQGSKEPLIVKVEGSILSACLKIVIPITKFRRLREEELPGECDDLWPTLCFGLDSEDHGEDRFYTSVLELKYCVPRTRSTIAPPPSIIGLDDEKESHSRVKGKKRRRKHRTKSDLLKTEKEGKKGKEMGNEENETDDTDKVNEMENEKAKVTEKEKKDKGKVKEKQKGKENVKKKEKDEAKVKGKEKDKEKVIEKDKKKEIESKKEKKGKKSAFKLASQDKMKKRGKKGKSPHLSYSTSAAIESEVIVEAEQVEDQPNDSEEVASTDELVSTFNENDMEIVLPPEIELLGEAEMLGENDDDYYTIFNNRKSTVAGDNENKNELISEGRQIYFQIRKRGDIATVSFTVQNVAPLCTEFNIEVANYPVKPPVEVEQPDFVVLNDEFFKLMYGNHTSEAESDDPLKGLSGGAFRVFPSQGILEPSELLEVTVEFHANLSGVYEDQLRCHFERMGDPYIIKLEALAVICDDKLLCAAQPT